MTVEEIMRSAEVTYTVKGSVDTAPCTSIRGDLTDLTDSVHF